MQISQISNDRPAVPRYVSELPLVGCSECAWWKMCGGMADQRAFWGCFTGCFTECQSKGCDWVCPNRAEFADYYQEVGGLHYRLPSYLRTTSSALPLYIPVVHHGHRRTVPLAIPFVALPTRRVISRRTDGTYGRPSPNKINLRDEFMLAPNVQTLLLSICPDKHLESYWHYRRQFSVPNVIANEKPCCITVPNFSFFSDAPRTHTLYNRYRMVRVAEELSKAGVDVILHLNAETEADWRYWTDVLLDQPHIKYVVKEFQTGLSSHSAGNVALNRMLKMQDQIGRTLHPLLVGGGQYIGQANAGFDQFTLIDSEPFIKTIKRRLLLKGENEDASWVKHTTQLNEPLDWLLSQNIFRYEKWLRWKIGRASRLQSTQ